MNVARLPTWRAHLACYLIEAAGLGTFMLVAGIVAAGLASLPEPLHTALSQHPERGRMAFGVLMGLTVIMLVYSPWGRRSGAHLNPAVTATFYALGKIDALDALFYAIAQFAGGAIGFAFVAFMLHNTLAKPS
ncbi:MAG TPA: aquaporin, partial [Candidatus Baltobacteraceae bacterium]